MHEFTLASDILETALAVAPEGRIARVLVDVGPDTHADPAILADAFEIAAGATRADSAVLELTRVEHGGIAVTAVDVGD